MQPPVGGGVSPLAVKVIVGAVCAILLVGGAAFCHATFFRTFPVMVNGEEVQVRVKSSVEDVLKSNDYFDVKPGRLLSVGGNVLDEAGGERCAVTMGPAEGLEPLKTAALSSTPVDDGDVLTVADGADVTEPYVEDVAPIAPGLQMERGGAIQYVKQWGRPGKQGIWKGEHSGETVDKGVIEEAQDLIIGSRNAKPAEGKCIALTFDDGPSRYTQRVLDILNERSAKATFYCVGTSVPNSPALVKAVIDGGHELASHTNAHKNLPTVGTDELRSEISIAFDALEDASGVRPQMIRAPYGAFAEKEWARAGDLISCNVLWNIDTLDWKLPGSDVIAQEVLSKAFNGAIALMHDGGGNREQNLEALPRIVDGLQAQGYEFVTVSELMKRDGGFPSDVVLGTVKMPEGTVMPQL